MNKPAASDEYEIIRQCLAGDSDRFSILVDRYKNMIYSIAYRMLGDQDAANDMAQESFIAAFTGLGNFQFGSKFSTWLYQILMNKCRDYLRAGNNKVSVDDIAELRSDPGDTPEQAAEEIQPLLGPQGKVVTLPQARADVAAIADRLALLYPRTNRTTGTNLLGANDALARQIKPSLLLLLGVVGVDSQQVASDHDLVEGVGHLELDGRVLQVSRLGARVGPVGQGLDVDQPVERELAVAVDPVAGRVDGHAQRLDHRRHSDVAQRQ